MQRSRILRGMHSDISLDAMVVVRLPNWVGDVCMVLPSLELLASTGARLVLCGKAFAKPLIRGIKPLEFITLSGKAVKDGLRVRKALQGLRQSGQIGNRPIRGLLYPDSLTSAIVFFIAGIPSAGYKDDGRSFLLKWPFDKPAHAVHAVMKWYGLTCRALEQWSGSCMHEISAQPTSYQYVPSGQDIECVNAVLQTHGLDKRSWVLLCPTATGLHKGQIKVWPYFKDLSENLRRHDFITVTCPPAHERDQAAQAVPDAIILEPLDLGAFAYLTSKASLVVCNDSGSSHIAAIAGARQLTLFGVTDPAMTGPWSENAIKLGRMGQWPDLATVTRRCLEFLQENTQA